jgi:hypothetical protein
MPPLNKQQINTNLIMKYGNNHIIYFWNEQLMSYDNLMSSLKPWLGSSALED